ncbi:MAG: DNA mismatch repair endonuclease MutL [Syntrophales bacterium]|nr:DNA mismatch repair endonuclease MutL [Syntrophales bacterium]
MNPDKGKIVVLPEDLTNKIAAGEVVERPSSVVKELVENSLDAGATDIIIELVKGGKEAIKVIDNGEGIGPEDAVRAFERYATSKIYSFDDIYKVKSFGFRGEALPSIASISRVELVTKRKESLSGTRVMVEGGELKDVMETGCPVGTSVSVSDIFYSVPVRKKFLKKDSTEQGHCVDVITKLVLPHPDVRVKVVADGRTILNIPRTKDLAERIPLVLGRDLSGNVLYVEGEKKNIRLKGFISSPRFTRSNTRRMLYYVNKRFIKDSFLNHAVMTSYRRLIETRRYPTAVLLLDLSPDDVDVNVHPTKMEVRFRNPREIYETIVESLVKVLAGISPVLETLEKDGRPLQEYRGRVREALKRYTISSDTKIPPSPLYKRGGREKLSGESSFLFPPFVEGGEGGLSDESATAGHAGIWEISEDKKLPFSSLEYMGQVTAAYLVFSSPDGIVLVDQHAAHERVLFEKLRKVSMDEKVVSQSLLIPEIVSLPNHDFALLMELSGVLEDVGIEVEPYGGSTVVIKSIPAALPIGIEPKALLLDVVEEISKTGKSRRIKEVKDEIFKILSCRGAIKANHKLTESEVENLCKDLDSTPFASTCPHGRPTYIQLNIIDLEKMFKRR